MTIDLDCLLKSIVDREQNNGIYYQQGPFVAFGYEQKSLNFIGSDIISINLIERENLNPKNFELWMVVYNKLKDFKDEHKIDEEDYRFNLKFLIEKNNISPVGVFYVSAGVTKEYFSGKTNNDSVDAMYLADRLGNTILREGISKNTKPFFGYANYNFNGVCKGKISQECLDEFTQKMTVS